MGCVPEFLVSPEGDWKQAGRLEWWFLWDALLGLVDLGIRVTSGGIIFSVSFLYSTCSVKTVAMKAYGNQTDCNLNEI